MVEEGFGGRSYVAVDAQLEVLSERKPLDARDVAKVKEPDVGQHLALPDVAGDDAAEDVNLDFHICAGIDPGKLRKQKSLQNLYFSVNPGRVRGITYWEKEDGGDGKREEHTIPVQLYRVELARKDTEAEGRGRCDVVPPERHCLVRGLEVFWSSRLVSEYLGYLRSVIRVDDAVSLLEEEPDKERGDGREGKAEGVEGVRHGKVDLRS